MVNKQNPGYRKPVPGIYYMKLLSYIPAWLKNKYLLTSVAFLLLMFFFDSKDIPSTIARWNKLKELQKSEQHLTQLISEVHKESGLLKTNAQTIEKYARENYMMKKDNEDLFVVKSTPEAK